MKPIRFIKLFACLQGFWLISTIPLLSQTTGSNSLDLNDKWEIIFDHNNEGINDEWYLQDKFDQAGEIKSINVPSAWETIEKDYEGVAFYRKRFEVPSEWKNKVIRIHFEAVNYIAELWINDHVVGFHEGGFTPFDFRIDQMIEAGKENVLIMRVISPIILSDKRIDGIGKLEMPSWRGGISGGIWQNVSISAYEESFFKDVFIQPDIHQDKVKFDVEIEYTGLKPDNSNLIIEISEANKETPHISQNESWTLKPGRNLKTFTLTVPDAKYWSPSSPFLYNATLKIINNEVISDSRTEKFGMRELTIKDKDFYLNGKPIYIKAAFFEGLYPNDIAYPDSKEMARKEIRLAKEAGFNMIRPWRHPPTPMWLDLADEMGVMVVGSPVLECMTLPVSTPYLPFRVENEITESVLRDRNRACVVQWELFNELHRPVLKQMMRPMALKVRDLDPTRLILDESGGWAFGANMYLPYEYSPTKFNDIHNYPGPFLSEDQYEGFLAVGMNKEEMREADLSGNIPGRNVVPGLMSFISELGYGSLPDLELNNKIFESEGNPLTPAYRYYKRIDEEQRVVLERSGFKEQYPEMRQFYLDQQKIHGEANRTMIEAVRSNPNIDGYCIHALVAGDWILGAGLLDIWRNPKSHAYEATKKANQPQILAMHINPRNIYAEKGAQLTITGINELEDLEGKLIVKFISSKGEIVYTKELNTTLAKGVKKLNSEQINTRNLKGKYKITAVFSDSNNQSLLENSIDCEVFPTENNIPEKDALTVYGLNDSQKMFLQEKGFELSPFNSKSSKKIPIIVAGYKKVENTDKKEFSQLLDFAEKGGNLIFLEEFNQEFLDSGILPFTANAHPARGLWTCISHMVQNDEIFKDIYESPMMDNKYVNVWAYNTLRDLKGENITAINPIVASVGFDWFSQNHKMHYSGPGSSWWGSDLSILEYGKGKIIISQLRIINNLGTDPVADKLLLNLIAFGKKN
jgi:beta-galactosidase